MFQHARLTNTVTLSDDKVCDNGNAIKHCNCQNNCVVIAWRKVCSCAPIFKFSYRLPKFSPRGKFVPKNTMAIFGTVRPHF